MTNSIGLTGASGILGRHLAHLFSKKKIKVFSTSRKKPLFKNKFIKWKKMDLEKNNTMKNLDKVFGNSKILIHAGAHVPLNSSIEDISKITKTNIKATYALYKWAKKNSVHFIFLSGAIVYKYKKNCKENSDYISKKDTIFYGYAKKICDAFLKKRLQKKEPITIFRPTSIYGWGLKKNKIMSKILIEAKQKKKIKLYKPFIKINFIHANDVANAIYKCIKGKKYGCFNLSSPKMYSIKDLAVTSNKLYKNKNLIEIFDNDKKNDYRYRFEVNSNLANKELGWKAKLDLKQGLKLTINKKYE